MTDTAFAPGRTAGASQDHPPPGAPPGSGGRQRALVIASGGAALTGCAALAAADPSAAGPPGLCPFYAATGLWCPLCGSLRAVHHLTNGELATAASFNLLLVLAVPLLVYAWLAWAAPQFAMRGPPQLRVTPRAWWTLLAVGLAFGVARNVGLLPVAMPTG